MRNSFLLALVITAFIFTLPLTLGATGAAAQSAQPAPSTRPETQFLDLAERRIAYDDTGGSGPIVICYRGSAICVSSIATSSRCWRATAFASSLWTCAEWANRASTGPHILPPT